MRFKNLLTTAVMSVAAVAVAPANAAFINGLVSISDGFVNGTIGTTTSIVGQLAPVQLNTVAQVTTNSCSFDFVPCPVGTTATLSTGIFNLPAGAQSTFTYNGFLFTANAAPTVLNRGALICTAGLCSDTLDFQFGGIFTKAGFDPTAGIFIFSAQGTCLQGAGNVCNGSSSASWSGSLAATGRSTTVPEPGSMALLGLGLGLAGWMSRRRKA